MHDPSESSVEKVFVVVTKCRFLFGTFDFRSRTDFVVYLFRFRTSSHSENAKT